MFRGVNFVLPTIEKLGPYGLEACPKEPPNHPDCKLSGPKRGLGVPRAFFGGVKFLLDLDNDWPVRPLMQVEWAQEGPWGT